MSNINEKRLPTSFFERDVLDVAPELLGKQICVMRSDDIYRYTISEVEAYRGEEDLACHASKGRTKRTEVMYWKGGHVYVYLIYGMYWLLNFVTNKEDEPQAVLIRGLREANGPGRVGKLLHLDKSFYGENLILSDRIWVENSTGIEKEKYTSLPRIGIDYAGDYWKNKPWRYILSNH